MENEILGAGRVLKNGEDGGHRAAKVGDVEGHCHVDCVGGADVGGDGGAVGGVVELGGFFESARSGDCGGEKENGG